MKKATIPILIISILFLIHCNSGSSNRDDSNPATVIKEIKKTIPVHFNKAGHIAIEGLIYPDLFVYDDSIFVRAYSRNKKKGMHQVVFRVSKDLEIVQKKLFNLGQGPGDLGGGTRFSGSGDYIYETDNTTRRISVYDKQLNFVKQVKCRNSIYVSTFFNNGTQFIAARGVRTQELKDAIGFQRECCIYKFPELTRTVFQVFGPYYPYSFKLKKHIIGKEAGYHFLLWKDHIYYLNMAEYNLKKFDLEGNPVKNIKVATEEIMTSKDDEREQLEDQAEHIKYLPRMKLADTVQPTSWMVPLEKGIAVVRRHSYHTDCSGLVECDYFDPDLNLLGKIKIPCFRFIYRMRGSFFANTAAYYNGHLYVLNDFGEDMELQKWEVTE